MGLNGGAANGSGGNAGGCDEGEESRRKGDWCGKECLLLFCRRSSAASAASSEKE